MKHIVLLFIALAICFSGTYGQRQKKPKIEFEQTLYNYDTILQGANGECLFIFKNIGDAPLTIFSASASCGCTTPSFNAKPVMPGRKGEITVKYNTSLVGPFRKTIVIKSNAENRRTSILTIKGYVKGKHQHNCAKRKS